MGPVVEAWMSNPVILNRAASGVLAIIPRDYMGRSDVVLNAEILIPLIKYFGHRISVNHIAVEVARFFEMGRPVGHKPISRHELTTISCVNLHVLKYPGLQSTEAPA